MEPRSAPPHPILSRGLKPWLTLGPVGLSSEAPALPWLADNPGKSFSLSQPDFLAYIMGMLVLPVEGGCEI